MSTLTSGSSMSQNNNGQMPSSQSKPQNQQQQQQGNPLFPFYSSSSTSQMENPFSGLGACLASLGSSSSSASKGSSFLPYIGHHQMSQPNDSDFAAQFTSSMSSGHRLSGGNDNIAVGNLPPQQGYRRSSGMSNSPTPGQIVCFQCQTTITEG